MPGQSLQYSDDQVFKESKFLSEFSELLIFYYH